MKFVFIILHFCAVDSTIQTIESLRSLKHFDKSEVIVVDNGSWDHSGLTLKNKYHGIPNIHILLSSVNHGFARGNNLGYQYARKHFSPDFIIILNNDVLMTQRDFLYRVQILYHKQHFHVLGPDIQTPEGRHQNPHRIHPFTLKDVNRILRNRSIILCYLKLKRRLHLEEQVQFIEKWDTRRAAEERNGVRWDKSSRNVVLHGSALIFSKDFIMREKNAFYPGTFMWMEEEILNYLCMQKQYTLLYSPSLSVLHMGGKSVDSTIGHFDKYLIYSQCLKQSALALKHLMLRGEK